MAELSYRIFSINPTQANCERNFSILNWILGENRNNLSLNKLESIAKIRSYYMNNIQRELNYVGRGFTENELRESVNIASVSSIIGLEDEDGVVNVSNNLGSSPSFSSTELAIGNIIDLMVNIDGNNEKRDANIAPAQPPELADLIYDPNDVLNEFLEGERRVAEN